jgi:histidine triad (HIT) family protein
MDGCPFCEIVRKRREHDVITAADGVVAFLCEPPATLGHTLIVPEAHRTDIWDLEPGEAKAAIELAHRLAAVMRDRLGAIGINLRQNSGAQAGQDVFHFHLHVVPRYEGDTVLPGCVWGIPPWQPPPNGAQDRRGTAEALRVGLTSG